ncbi:MAG: cell division protein ZipA C-terminal FtsZ-binding domain-containing protein [Sulfurimicrobium sp.]|nr:cell division protein ZipA C-terminal FtsZ-binding domain-containing protein [Sulfurimicrobium sp.]MDP1704774.1 cell division protein ZipA C-terminal FtsZ-binding domain-containing protein [Sulfurimicrobium sp.]MDP2199285.1 cell division protein ZipA C-terminal FtsZ-binding domain-containing protein [Sulfurimicrobium sp.]MDP3686599.1 cell division protein ZipA C-terminal FtsZ-binding domain-containing protein [Sulfurimicrobium sp.]
MNELQVSLLAIGVVVIFAVLAFNRWQERKYRRQAEQRFASQHDDILLREESPPERVEPMLDTMAEGEIAMPDEPEPGIHPAWGAPVMEEAEETQTPPPATEPAQMEVEPASETAPTPAQASAHMREAALEPDAATEYIATLSASDPITAHALILILQQLKSVGKPVRWLGQRHQLAPWEDIAQAAPGTEFLKLAACMQLSDRNGPVRSEELDAFCDMAQAVAANLYAVIDCPDKQSALAAAIDLDQFCADVDILIGFNIISKDGTPFAGTKLRGLAESAGMKLMPDGSFHYLNDHGAQLFSLGNLESTPFTADAMKQLTTHGVTFLFDVPKAVGGVQAFNQMLQAARQFVGPLSALMVDDNRRELTDAGIDKIRQQLLAIYDKMEQRGIRSGSPRSKRLFA